MTVTTGGPWGSNRPFSTTETSSRRPSCKKHLSPRDLGDVQEPGESTLERLGDYFVDRLERVFVAIEGEERFRSPQPGQQLVESVCFCELVAENRLEQLERVREVPADVLKTALAQREREPGNLGQGARRRLPNLTMRPAPPLSAPLPRGCRPTSPCAQGAAAQVDPSASRPPGWRAPSRRGRPTTYRRCRDAPPPPPLPEVPAASRYPRKPLPPRSVPPRAATSRLARRADRAKNASRGSAPEPAG